MEQPDCALSVTCRWPSPASMRRPARVRRAGAGPVPGRRAPRAGARSAATRCPDPYDEALVAAKEAEAAGLLRRAASSTARNPMPHLANLDVSLLRPGLRAGRAAGRRPGSGTWRAWPEAVDGCDRRAGRGARAGGRRDAVRGPRPGRPAWTRTTRSRARPLRRARPAGRAPGGRPAAATAATAISARPRWAPTGWPCCCAAAEATDVDLAAMSARADAERDRLRAMLDEACGRLGARPADRPSWSRSWCATTRTPTAWWPRRRR